MTGFRISAIFAVVICAGCQSATETSEVQRSNVEKVAEEFFETYAQREDWNKLLSFYSKEMQFEDVLLQLKTDDFEEFKKFYDWPDPNFKKLSPDQKHLVVESLATLDDRVAVARGHFNPFMWQGNKVNTPWGMEFTIWLYFDDQLKIIRQIDWIEYDDSVLESVINRIRKDGLNSKPPGL